MRLAARADGTTTKTAQNRWEALDLLRFLAAAAVVAYHYAPRFVVGDAMTYIWTRRLAQFGYLGVEIFFVISGAVIVLSAQNKSARAFLVFRAVRLYPMFWIALLLAVSATLLLGTGAAPTLSQLFANVTMLPGYLGEPAVDDAYWTLAVEWKFYFLVAILLVIGLSDHWERLARAWIVLIAAQHVFGPITLISSITIYPYGSHFAFGAMLLALRRSGPSATRVSWAGAAICTCLWTTLRVHAGFVPGASSTTSAAAGAIIFTVFGLLLLHTISTRLWRMTGFAEQLGSSTYPLYLLHAGVFYPVSDWLHETGLVDPVRFIVVLLLLSGSTFASAKYVEKGVVKRLARSRWVWRIAGLRVNGNNAE